MLKLSIPLNNFLRLQERQKKALEKLGIKTAQNLLWHFPFRYEKPGEVKAIADLSENDSVTINAKILEIDIEKTWRKKMAIAKAVINDGSGSLRIVWFNQPYVANILKPASAARFSGKVQRDKNGLYIANPIFEKIPYSDFHDPDFENNTSENYFGVYPETKGISSRWIRAALKKILQQINLKTIEDSIPQEILKKYHLPSLKMSLISIHFPKKPSNAQAARKRFSFEEIFYIQLNRLGQKAKHKEQSAFPIKTNKDSIKEFLLSSFDFKLTSAQKKAIEHILADFQKTSPMTRLLEGDVGSGKTAVAAATAFTAVKNNYQVAYMAPTEVLSRQHFKSFSEYFSPFKTKIGLITSAECLKFPSKIKGPGGEEKPTHISRSQLLKWVESGETPILIGTHALIQNKVKFKNLAFIVIDEQHRFGTGQRAKLTQKNTSTFPHLLSMTATPIPRTLALTIYGDLDLTLLDEMPPGRKKVVTKIIPSQQRNIAYKHIREEIKKGRQAYVICPRIEESDPSKINSLLLLDMKSVKKECERLKKEIFPEFEIGMLHGKLKPKEKEDIMKRFNDGKIKILVATSVIEVGINVPNATSILIEGAERFGLAQLHQLRGRVLRSTHQPYCFIFTDSNTKKTRDRLNALLEAKNGFELAEYDLQFRGPGELSGKRQWGISDIGMEALKNIKMVEAAREEAQAILKKDPELKNHPLLAVKANPPSASQRNEQTEPIHFE